MKADALCCFCCRKFRTGAVSAIHHNAMYTSLEIQNQVIEVMSTLVTEEIVRDAFYTVKVNGPRDTAL